MRTSSAIETLPTTPVSPLVLSDRLLRLAEDADTVGLRLTAEHLLALASDVLDQPPRFIS